MPLNLSRSSCASTSQKSTVQRTCVDRATIRRATLRRPLSVHTRKSQTMLKACVRTVISATITRSVSNTKELRIKYRSKSKCRNKKVIPHLCHRWKLRKLLDRWTILLAQPIKHLWNHLNCDKYLKELLIFLFFKIYPLILSSYFLGPKISVSCFHFQSNLLNRGNSLPWFFCKYWIFLVY